MALTGLMSTGRCSGPFGLRQGMLTFNVFWRRLRVLKSGSAQSRPINRSRLSTKPVVCQSAIPNGTFIFRQVRIAPSLQPGVRPRLPVVSPPRVISGSDQIVSGLRRLSTPLQAGPFPVFQAGGVGLLMPPSHHAGFTR